MKAACVFLVLLPLCLVGAQDTHQPDFDVETHIHDHGNAAKVKIIQTSVTPSSECYSYVWGTGDLCIYNMIETTVRAFGQSLGISVRKNVAQMIQNADDDPEADGPVYEDEYGNPIWSGDGKSEEATQFKVFFKSVSEFEKNETSPSRGAGDGSVEQERRLGYDGVGLGFSTSFDEISLSEVDHSEVRYHASLQSDLANFDVNYVPNNLLDGNYTLPASAVQTDLTIRVPNTWQGGDGTFIGVGLLFEGTTAVKKVPIEGDRRYGEKNLEKVSFASSNAESGETMVFTWENEASCDGVSVPVIAGELREPTAYDGANEDNAEVLEDEQHNDEDDSDVVVISNELLNSYHSRNTSGNSAAFQSEKKQNMLHFYFDTPSKCNEIVWSTTTAFEQAPDPTLLEGLGREFGRVPLMFRFVIGSAAVVSLGLVYLMCSKSDSSQFGHNEFGRSEFEMK